MLPTDGDGKGREREGRDPQGPGMAVTGTAARRNGVSRSREADVASSECAKSWLVTVHRQRTGRTSPQSRGVSAE